MDEAHQYGYALQEICDYLGKRLECEYWNDVRWSAVEQSGLEDLLTKTGPPVELPFNTDFPRIGYIQRDQVIEHLDAARTRAKYSHSGDLQFLLDEYVGWLNAANDQRFDIVFFYQ